jgi:hypothetical protein
MGENGYKFLEENYTVEKSYEIIMKHSFLSALQNFDLISYRSLIANN